MLTTWSPREKYEAFKAHTRNLAPIEPVCPAASEILTQPLGVSSILHFMAYAILRLFLRCLA